MDGVGASLPRTHTLHAVAEIDAPAGTDIQQLGSDSAQAASAASSSFVVREAIFDDLVGMLRETAERGFIDREVDIRPER